MSDEFKVIETQEDFDKAIQKRLAQKDRELSERYKDYTSPDDLEKIKAEFETRLAKVNEDLKSANEKIAGHDQIVTELTNRATTAEGDLLKSRIAYESGVPFELAGRLMGNNEEELKADAEKLASFIAPKAAPPLRSSDSSNNNNADMASLLSQINSQFMN